jgi:hypothetical protein
MRKTNSLVKWGGLFVVLVSWAATAVAADSAPNPQTETQQKQKQAPKLDYIAIVGGEKISLVDYISALRRGMRKRFYHGKIPEDELKTFRKEVAEELVERQLKIQEAKRRGIKPDAAAVEKGVKGYDERFKDDPEWAKAREQVLAQVRVKLQGDSLAQKLDEAVHKVSTPSEAEIKAYYEAHPDLFTTPERERVSLILLRVDPSSPGEAWKEAGEEATDIVERLNKGADFAELARIHSSDESAQNGGDMGFVHAGMLGENAQQVLAIMEPGEISAPVVMLEGIAIFRLDERTKPQLNDFASVKDRAEKLLMREKGEQDWKALLSKLHKDTKVEINDAPWR